MRKYWTVIGFFASATPVGILLGVILSSVSNSDAAAAVSALASGMLPSKWPCSLVHFACLIHAGLGLSYVVKSPSCQYIAAHVSAFCEAAQGMTVFMQALQRHCCLLLVCAAGPHSARADVSRDVPVCGIHGGDPPRAGGAQSQDCQAGHAHAGLWCHVTAGYLGMICQEFDGSQLMVSCSTAASPKQQLLNIDVARWAVALLQGP